jgi:hypothetical protein
MVSAGDPDKMGLIGHTGPLRRMSRHRIPGVKQSLLAFRAEPDSDCTGQWSLPSRLFGKTALWANDSYQNKRFGTQS